MSDHNSIYCVVKGGVPKLPPREFEYRSFKTYDKDVFVNDLKQVPWHSINHAEDIDDAVLMWERMFSDVADQHAPIKFCRAKGTKNPWVTNDLIEIRRDRDYHQKKAKTSGSPYHWSMYRKLRNCANRTERKLKSSYYCKLINDSKGDSNGMWKAIKSTLPCKVEPDISTIVVKGKRVTDRKSVVEVLNKFFASIGKKLTSHFKGRTQPETPTTTSNGPTFNLQQVSSANVEKELRKLKTNKACGLDKLSARLLKDSAPVIASSVAELINRSFGNGRFPKVWKSAKITAIFKKGDRTDPTNYRPISILPTLSKIIERAAHNQLYTFIQDNKLLMHGQHGFQQRRATTTALTKFTDEILNKLDHGHVTGVVYLDLKKAFDTVDHTILIHKLKNMGVSGYSLAWFDSYLGNRTQKVSIESTLSDSRKVTTGVPQGSIMGPLLFLVFINGIQRSLRHSQMTLFADDMALYCSSANPSKLQTLLNEDLHEIAQWLSENKLTINIEKSKFMLIGNRRRLESFSDVHLTIHDDQLGRVTEYKYLGIIIEETLSWQPHIDEIQRKVNQRLGLLKRIKHLLPSYARKLYVTTMIMPILEYGCIIWADRNNQILMNSLQVCLNKAAKIVLDRHPNSSASEALQTLGWCTLAKRRTYHRCLYVFKSLHHLLDEDRTFTSGADVHSYNTRYKKDLRKEQSSTTKGLLRSGCIFVKDWNALPIEIREIMNLSHFCKELRTEILR